VTPTLPLADAAALLGRARATRALRLGLAALIAGLLGAALVLTLRAETGEAPLAEPGRTTILVVDVSSSIQPRVFRQVGDALDRAMREGGRFGVVLFSDIAYELLPPGTPAAELAGLRRYFVPVQGRPEGVPTLAVGGTRLGGGTRFLEGPWNRSFTAGTRISTGLVLARRILARERVPNGKVVLVSDLEDEYLDLPELGRVLAGYAEQGLPLRVVGLSPSVDDRRIFRRLLAESGQLEDAPPPRAAESEAALPAIPFPVALALVAVVLTLVLGLNEHLLARLPLLADEGRG
jgi:hypothetical protein